MKKTTTLKALALSMIMTLGLALPMMAQTDNFFKSNNEDIYENRAGEPINVTGNKITNQQFNTPLGSGLLIMVAAGAGYVVARRKRARKGMTLLLAAAMLIGMTQCKKRIETVTPIANNQDGLVSITLTVDNGAKHYVVTDPGNDYGKVYFTNEDEIYVVNGGNLIGILVYNGTTERFEGMIGFDLLEYDDDDPSSLVVMPLSDEDYLHFVFLGNANKYELNGGLYANISGQKDGLPVLSLGRTASYYISDPTDPAYTTNFTCELQNKCALAKFTFKDGGSIEDDVTLLDMPTEARLLIDGNNVDIVPVSGKTSSITLNKPNGNDERFAILLPQSSSSNCSMMIQNTIYRQATTIVAMENNGYKEYVLDNTSSGNPVAAPPFYTTYNKKVTFSTGNLQYKAGEGYGYQFAPNQYDIIGNAQMDPSYTGYVDLFGWGTGDNALKMDIDSTQYEPFVDWGDYVHVDGKTWYTPNIYELLGLIAYKDPKNEFFPDEIRYNKSALGTVNGVEGMIILPDYWTLPTGLNFVPGDRDDWEHWSDFKDNIYDVSQWTAMENNGAIFIPEAGKRCYDKKNSRWVYYGDASILNLILWSSFEDDDYEGCAMVFGTFGDETYAVSGEVPRSWGCSVRLVSDDIPYPVSK